MREGGGSMSIGKKIRERRIERGLTQREVANYVGVTEATISRWESSCIGNMRRDRISKLANILKMSPADIVGVSDNKDTSLESVDTVKTNISSRLTETLQMRNMKAIDLAKETGLSRGVISQYLAGRISPKRDNLFLLAKALHVSEAWLRGYNVDPKKINKVSDVPANTESINSLIKELFSDRPDVYSLLINGVYITKGGQLVNKKLSELPKSAKEALRNNLLFILESSGYLPEEK